MKVNILKSNILLRGENGKISAENFGTYPKSEGQLVLMDAQGSYVTKTTQTLDINKMSSITLGAYTYGGSEEAVQWSYKLGKNATATEENGRLTIQMTGAGSMGVTAIAADGRKAVVTI